jgi:hypothetical protein
LTVVVPLAIGSLAAAGDRLASLDLLLGPVARRRDQRDRVWAAVTRRPGPAVAEQALATLAQGQCLVLGHRLGPANQFARVGRRRFGEDDLEGALVSVRRVLGIERIAPRRSLQRALVLGDHFDRRPLARSLALRPRRVASFEPFPTHRRRLSPLAHSRRKSPTAQIRGSKMPS